MPASQRGRHLGVKAINIFPGNSAASLPGLHAVYLLFDAATGVPVSLMDGSELQAVAEGQLDPARALATLAQLCREQHPGRQQGSDVTVLKAVGTALEDLAAAELALGETSRHAQAEYQTTFLRAPTHLS